MKTVTRRSFLTASAGALAAPYVAWGQQAQPHVRFAIGWTWQSIYAMWTLAQDRGHFASEKVTVSLDRGYGSGDNMTKLAAGALDIAMVDPNLLAKFNVENPTNQLICVFIIFDAAPAAVNFLRASGIAKPKDLEGKTIAVTEADSTTPLFKVLASLNNIDLSKVKTLTVSGALREPMVVQKRADASLAYVTTAVPNFAAAGIQQDQIGFLLFSDYGMPLYSAGLVCRKDYAAANGEAISAVIRAGIKGTRDMLKDPVGAVASIRQRDGLVDEKAELARNELNNKVSLLTPWVRKNGMSTVERDRFERTTGQVAEAFGMAHKPKMEEIYTDRFLPPQRDRMIT